MSKMDNLRAMREAKYAETLKRSAASGAATGAASRPPVVAPDLCGHRNKAGRSCTREQGHAAKSHRYS